MKTITLLLFVGCVVASFIYPSDAAIYRSAATGNWSAAASWEVFNSNWGPATGPPGATDEISVLGGHVISIQSADAHAGSLLIESGATVRLASAVLALNIYNLSPAADLLVLGVFEDHAGSGAGNGLRFQGGGSWQLGSDGLIVKTSNSSAATYRDHYEGGMAAIPPTANWIIRYLGSGSPSFTTNNTYYPNLTFESFAGPWDPASGFSRFQGSQATAVILGNLNIGGSGGNPVTIYNENTNPEPIRVEGQCIVQAGSTLTNGGSVAGTGMEVRGSLTIQGVLNLSADAGVLRLSGAGPQFFSGAGTVILRNMELVNPGGLQLQRELELLGDLSLLAGKVVLNQSDLIVRGVIDGTSSNNYIQSNLSGQEAGGLIRNAGSGVFFPVGNGSFNPILLTHSGAADFKVRVEEVVWSQGTAGSPMLAGVVSRSWYVEGNTGGPLSATVQWQAGDERPGFDRSQCYISVFQNGGWQAGTPGPAEGGGPYSRSLFGFGFNQTGILSVASGGLLPVELTFFKVRHEHGQVLAAWQTATETNSDYFAVERSFNGNYFLEIGRVAGAGQSHEQRDYTFVDPAPLPGLSYYRLRQADRDGQVNYSPVQSIQLPASQPGPRLAANPVREKLRLQWPEKLAHPARMNLFDRHGRLVFGEGLPAGTDRHELPLPGLPHGLYLLQVKTKEEIFVRRFVKW